MNDLEHRYDINLEKRINNWIKEMSFKPFLTDSDSEEIKSHLFDIMDNLKKLGLDEEEAFIIASRRLGEISDLESDYHEVNNSVLQMRKSLAIMAGVFVYFLFYYFFLGTSKLLYIGLYNFDFDNISALIWINRYFLTFHFIIIIFIASIYFSESLTVKLIEKINLKPSHIIIFFFLIIILIIGDSCLKPITKNFMKTGVSIANQIYDIYFYFDYSFTLVICFGFVVLYFKYFSKNKIPY